ncbi:MAG: motif putative anchor domain protein [Cypionkella sp.]|uniref:VPLPA-CTERM sorting domain-containing protein n=1 Tax=Cypionkella sp. TaxID=2811411 RepID=UPI002630C0A1|nr:VPLPA-CTERM sorting domain-containing protein [Cypionkella sp.]MDB5658280.1 motif putative anchor domain protein [Cypionkella sp.]
MKTIIASLVLAMFAAAPLSAAPVILFQDDFSSYGPGDVLNAPDSVFNGNWKVSGGTVDYLAPPGVFSGLCSGQSNCVDLDGSTGQSGLFETAQTFSNNVFDVLFQISGNNRSGSDTVTITFGSIVRSITLAYDQVANQSNFGTDFLGVAVGGIGTTLSFQNAGGDNVGIILKTALVQTSAVPVPAAGGLMALGLAGLAALRRRKHRA